MADNMMTDQELADALRAHPDRWAVVLEGGDPPSPDLEYLPSEPVLAMARRVWEARGPWAPLGDFAVVIRDNDLYMVANSRRDVLEPMSSYERGSCFFCGRPATHLAWEVAAKTCQVCIPSIREALEDGLAGLLCELTFMELGAAPVDG